MEIVSKTMLIQAVIDLMKNILSDRLSFEEVLKKCKEFDTLLKELRKRSKDWLIPAVLVNGIRSFVLMMYMEMIGRVNKEWVYNKTLQQIDRTFQQISHDEIDDSVITTLLILAETVLGTYLYTKNKEILSIFMEKLSKIKDKHKVIEELLIILSNIYSIT